MSFSERALVLDFDQSVLPLADDEIRVSLGEWQERIRFGSSMRDFRELESQLLLPAEHGCVFMGSGDYHHVSHLLLQRFSGVGEPFEVVVCDNHPDNMLYPFGIHCGSWVGHASKLPFISHIHVVGITSSDITLSHAWENSWAPLKRGRVSYWSVGKSARWLNWIGAGEAHHSFANADDLVDGFLARRGQGDRVYLSIDKDVFAKDVVQTNWDQGCFEFRHIEALLGACCGKLVGVDVTGEISGFKYRSLFKRLLAGLDGLELPDAQQLRSWQESQQSFNLRLLEALQKRYRYQKL